MLYSLDRVHVAHIHRSGIHPFVLHPGAIHQLLVHCSPDQLSPNDLSDEDGSPNSTMVYGATGSGPGALVVVICVNVKGVGQVYVMGRTRFEVVYENRNACVWSPVLGVESTARTIPACKAAASKGTLRRRIILSRCSQS